MRSMVVYLLGMFKGDCRKKDFGVFIFSIVTTESRIVTSTVQ